MVSIFFSPDKTQIVTAVLKNGRLQIKSVNEMDSRFNIFLQSVDKDKKSEIYYSPFFGEREKELSVQPQAVVNRQEALFQFFTGLKKDLIEKFDEVYIVLPDELFSVIDCFDYTTEANLNDTIAEISDMSIEDLVIATPFEATPGQFNKKTVYAIQGEIIEDIISAATRCDIPLNSIEAASMSVIRAVANWRTEKIFLPIYSTSADLISYSPLGGMFRLETDLSGNYFEKYKAGADNEIRSVLFQRDVAAEKTFKSINLNVPVYVLGNSASIANLPSLSSRIGTLNLSEFIESEPNLNLNNYIGAVGTMLQVIEDSSEIYSTRPSFLKIKSGNLLPENIRVGTRIKRFGNVTRSVLKKAVALLTLLLVVSVGIFFYFSNIKVSTDLQSNYEAAQKEESVIKRDFEILELSKKEDYHPVESFITLLKYRPEELKFLNINIGSNSGNIANDWVKFTVVSKDPILFQNMLSQLREEKTFNNCTLSEINSDNTGFKKANFMLGKGGAK